MRVKDIVLKACDFIGNEELPEILQSGETDGLSEEQSEELSTLIKCFNLVRNEVATEYKNIVKIEKFTTENGKVDFDKFSFGVVDILAVKDKVGDDVKFKVFDDYLTANATEIEVYYSSSPKELTIDDEFTSNLPERVFAYGVAKEYYFLQNLYDDAEVWNGRFKNSLQSLLKKKSETVISRRRWI
jgi:hypothetical protein